MSDTAKTGMKLPRTLVIAAPAASYVAITGPTLRDWSAADTALGAGGAFLLLLFLPEVLRGMAAANKAAAANRKQAKAKAKADEKAKKD
ncbi:hypothetical protein [Streptomyces sp. NPDC054797]